MDEPCVFSSCSVACVLADGQRCQVNNAVRLHVKLLSHSWDHEFKVLRSGPFPAFLGLDFLRRTGMTIDVAAKRYGFSFAPQCSGALSPPNPMVEKEQFLQALCEEVCNVASGSEASINGVNLGTMVRDFPALFSSTEGAVNCAACDIELSDPAPVRSPPYRCVPPKLAIFKNIVLALCWLLWKVKDMGRLGRWILRLAPHKFRVKHTRGSENVVADALSRMFEETPVEVPESSCTAIWQSLPLVYASLGQHQLEDQYCKVLRDRLCANPGSVDSFQISRDLLCFHPKKAKRRRWVIPASLKSMLLQYYLDSALAGLLGARTTFQKIATNFLWPRMRAEIFEYVRKCDLCQRAKPAQDARVGMHASIPCSRPMERLFVNFVGPLTRSMRGNVAILVVVDAFSKFVSFFPVRRMTSQAVVDCLEKWYFPAYGTPTSVVTDNTRVFCCKYFREVRFRWGITHITTTPNYPQASLAERVNRNLKSALKIFHHESQVEWDTDLPWLGLAFNTAVHDSTKCTPDKLFLGRELGCPLSVRWDLSPVGIDGNEESTRLFWTRAYENLKLAWSKVARRYDAKRKPHQYGVGETVVFRLNIASSKAQNISAKILMRWSKPVVISKFVGPNTVLLANPDTGVHVRAHVSQLKPYVR
jgi:hypothetical protein